MQMHCARSDGEAQARSARLAIAIIFDPIEGPENFLNGFVRYSLAVIAHTNHRKSIWVHGFASQRNLNLSSLSGVTHAVAHHVFDCASDQLKHASHGQRLAYDNRN